MTGDSHPGIPFNHAWVFFCVSASSLGYHSGVLLLNPFLGIVLLELIHLFESSKRMRCAQRYGCQGYMLLGMGSVFVVH